MKKYPENLLLVARFYKKKNPNFLLPPANFLGNQTHNKNKKEVKKSK